LGFRAQPCRSQNTTPTPIKIGYIIVASDPAGQPPLKAMRMAAQEINAAGGVLGRRVEIITAYTPTKDYSKVPELLDRLLSKKIDCIITSGGSAMTLKAAELTIPRGLLLFTASSTSPKIADLKDNNLVWRTIPSDIFQGNAAAKFLDSLGVKRVGIIHVDHPYGNGLSAVFKQEFEQNKGSKVVEQVSYKEVAQYKDVDFIPLLKRLYAAKPEAVYMITYGEDGAAIINQSYRTKLINQNYKPFFIGCDANYNNDFITGVESQEYIEGMAGLTYIHPKQYPNFDKFYERYSTFEEQQDSADIANASLAALLNIESTKTYAATAYDAIYTIALAMEKAQSTDAQKVAAVIRAVTTTNPSAETINVGEFAKAKKLLQQGKEINYDGASGYLDFDANGDVTSATYNIWKIKNGSFTDAGSIESSRRAQQTTKTTKGK
jgi:ABC-type branched-subunit amino acid transport system substrate-binding protein